MQDSRPAIRVREVNRLAHRIQVADGLAADTLSTNMDSMQRNTTHQDVLLEQLGESLDVLLSQAKQISGEITVQTEIIGNQSIHMDETKSNFTHNITAVDVLNKKSSCCTIL
jgi:hypothetical protein